MIYRHWAKILARFGLSVVILVFFITASMHFAYTPDDTYIYLQFAKNIVLGNGFAFNAGEPTYGITSPLWLLIISTGGWLGVDVYMVAKVLDLVFAGFALVVLYIFAFEVLGDRVGTFCVTLIFSANIWFLRWAGTGMETSFAVLLLLLTLLFCLKRKYFLAVNFSALLTLTRPEAGILVVLILADVYLNSVDKKQGRSMLLALALLYGALLIPWVIYAFVTFGTIVPNTALAKAAMAKHIDDFAWTLTDTVKTLAVSDGLVIIVFVVGMILLFRKRETIVEFMTGKPESEQKAVSSAEWMRFHSLPLMWIAALPVVYVITNANVVSRYLLLIIPVIIVYAFAVLWRTLALLGKKSIRGVTALAFTAIILLQNQVIYYTYVKPSIEAFSQGMQECFIPIGRWSRAYTPEDTVVFVPDIGAIGYHAERTICDAVGLVSPKFLGLVREGYSLNRMMEERLYLTMCAASYVVHRSHVPNEYEGKDLQPLFTKVVFGLGLTNPSTVYYTVYKVGEGAKEQNDK